MDDVKVKAKKAILEEIMKLMDEGEMEGLKAKSPKFAAVEMEMKPEDKMEMDKDESMPEMPMGEDEIGDDDKERLKELYEKYC